MMMCRSWSCLVFLALLSACGDDLDDNHPDPYPTDSDRTDTDTPTDTDGPTDTDTPADTDNPTDSDGTSNWDALDGPFSLAEGSAAGVVAVQLAASDGLTITAINSGNTGGAFSVGAGGQSLVVATPAALDFETTASFTLDIAVNGLGGETRNVGVTIAITDANDAPLITGGPFVDIPRVDGAAVGTMSVTDQDAGQTHTFLITAGDDAGVFALNPATGALTVASAAAALETYTLTIEVTDSGTPPLAADVQVLVTFATPNAAPTVTSATFTLLTPLVNGAVVGSLSVTDPQVTQTHTFAIAAGNDAGIFAVDAATGVITVADGAAATAGTVTLTIEATDDGNPPLSGSGSAVIDIVEAVPTAQNDGISALTGAQATYNLLANDTVGVPGGIVTSVGGGSLSTTAPANGAPIAFAGGTLTVAANGDVTIDAAQPGTFTFDYTVSNGFSSSATVTVTVCANLAVGTTLAGRLDQLSSLCIQTATGDASEYVFMPMNVSATADYPLAVTGSGIVAIGGAPAPGLGGSPSPDTHTSDREAHHQEVAARLGTVGSGTPVSPPSSIPAGVPNVGDIWSLNGNTVSSCSTGSARAGTVKFVGTNVILVADNDNPAGGLTDTQYNEYATTVDTVLYPAVTALYGAPTDHDGNGRVVLFFTRAMNELSPPASSSVVLSRHMTRDLANQTECPTSNDGEILYQLAADPTGAVNGNVRTVSFVTGSFGPTVHELGHLVIDARRVASGAPFEEAWLDEALAAGAVDRSFFATSFGLTPLQNIVLADLTTGPNASRRVAAFNTYENILYSQIRTWMQGPPRTGIVDSAASSLAQRGIGWMFLRYVADRHAVTLTDEASFFAEVASSTLTGRENLEDIVGDDLSLYLRDFMASVYLDDAPGVAPANALPEYITRSWSYRSIFGGLGGFPLALQTLSPDVPTNYALSRGGSASYLRFSVSASATATLTQSIPAGTHEAWYVLVRNL